MSDERHGPFPILAGFVVQERLARGAHGTVFIAKRAEDGALFALKCVDRTSEQSTPDLSLLDGFSHPNVVQILAQPDADSVLMGLVDGASLRELMLAVGAMDEDLPVSVCAEIARQTALGLAALHVHGAPDQSLVHGDVNPSNVLVGYDGVVRIVDFGTLTTESARTKERVGTMEYLPPEAKAGNPPRQEWDMFALGSLLFELLTGRCPTSFAGDDHDVDSNVELVPDLQDFRDDVPPTLEELLYELLAPEPELRPRADVVASRLADVVAELRPQPRLAGYLDSFFSEVARARPSARSTRPPARTSPLGFCISGAAIKATFDYVVQRHGARGYELIRAHFSRQTENVLQRHVDSSAWYDAGVVVELTEIAESIFGNAEQGEVARALGAASADYALSANGPYRVFRERGLREGISAFLLSTQDIYGLYYDRGHWRVESLREGAALCRHVDGGDFPPPITERMFAYLARGLELVGAEHVRLERELDGSDLVVRLTWNEPVVS